MKESPELLRALCALRGSSDFKVFIKALEEDEATETQRCITGDGPILYRAQGAAKKLQDIVSQYANAPLRLEQIQKRQ